MAETATKKPGRPEGGLAAGRSDATVFGHAVAAIGMTQDDVAGWLGVSVQAVRYYATGRRNVPDAVMDKVAALWEQVSFRSAPVVPLPLAAHRRREALQALRARTWKRKIPVIDADMHDMDDEGLE